MISASVAKRRSASVRKYQKENAAVRAVYWAEVLENRTAKLAASMVNELASKIEEASNRGDNYASHVWAVDTQYGEPMLRDAYGRAAGILIANGFQVDLSINRSDPENFGPTTFRVGATW